jgi:hypothetical protein
MTTRNAVMICKKWYLGDGASLVCEHQLRGADGGPPQLGHEVAGRKSRLPTGFKVDSSGTGGIKRRSEVPNPCLPDR